MDATTVQFYEENAADISRRYESVNSPVERYFAAAFVPGARVLDIGAGSGRDAARLLAEGFDAYGVEPSEALRQASILAHPELGNRLKGASLPELGQPFGGGFDGILCSAVLMHVPSHEIFDAAMSIRSMLKAHGRLLISLPLSRGEDLTLERDGNGRLFKGYLAEEIQLLFERLGFQLIGRWDTEDALARSGTSWYTLLLELRESGVSRAVDKIEGVLNRDRKVATYKLALFRALAEIATQESRQAVWQADGQVGVPLIRIAERWLQYYWPLFASERFIPQSEAEGAGSNKAVKFREPLMRLISEYRQQGAHGGLSALHLDWSSNRMNAASQLLLKTALRSVAEAIRDGPVAFSGGALESGKVFEFDRKTGLVSMPTDIWRELSLLGHWIVDAVVLRWASLTERFSYRQGLTAGDVIPLLLVKPAPERATALARQAFERAGLNRCTWSGKTLRKEFVVDHAIPFSLWGNNDLWNLMQVDAKVNGQKSDKLPEARMLVERRSAILEDWDVLRSAMPDAFNRQASHLLGEATQVNSSMTNELFARFREAVELTALQRGVERWAL
jgi:SAM-dependent methyltransferase